MDDINQFSRWLQDEMNKRGLNQSQLAKLAGVTRSAINGVISGVRGPGSDLCVGLARALKLPPEDVFRAAGLLPPETKRDPVTDEAEYLLSQLPENKRQQALAFIRFLANENYSPAGMEQAKPETP
jgi:transcriptional regulator with XRE-family HTH domain